MIRINRYAAGSFALSVLVAILLTTACDPENNETDEPASEPTRHATDEGGGETATEEIGAAEDASRNITQAATKTVTAGSFALTVPADWNSFSPSEAAALRQQYMAQSKEIYRQFSGADDRTKTVDVVAFHIANDSGSFVLVSFTVPATSDLIPLLKSQVEEKMAWGIREGDIRKYLGLTSVDDKNFSGFYTKAIGKGGGVEVSGGLEHKNLKNTIVQLTLLSPKEWEEAKATATLTTILDSVILQQK